MAQYFLDFIYSFTNCMCCFPSSPHITINSSKFKLQRLLGEGGFSYVYLVQDVASPNSLYALKKIRAAFGEESVALAMKEVDAYDLFSNANIIKSIDHAVVSGDRSDPSAKTVYILLPYYRRGNLQDVINANIVNQTFFPEKELMVLFLGVCRALKAMHHYKVSAGSASTGTHGKRDSVAPGKRRKGMTVPDEDDDEAPLMDGEVAQSQDGVGVGELRAYAHRDIKPGNIMLSDDGLQPILMDLGSLKPSPTPITSRSQALIVQDEAAEHSTMPYRAPELFDVQTDTTIDTKVDIWSMGCTLYACLFGKSPFEARSDETGGSLSMSVLGGDWRFPDEDAQGTKGSPLPAGQSVGAGTRRIVKECLKLEPAERPDIDQLITMVEELIRELPAA